MNISNTNGVVYKQIGIYIVSFDELKVNLYLFVTYNKNSFLLYEQWNSNHYFYKQI